MYHTFKGKTHKTWIVLVEESLNSAVFRGLSGSTAPDRDKHKLKVTADLIKAVDSRQHKSVEKCMASSPLKG
jgi:hypothetical protein